MSEGQGAGPAQRGVEVGTAIGVILFGLIITIGSIKAGIGWGAEGPKSGFFPFYLGIIIMLSSAVNLVEAARGDPVKRFAEWSQLRQVLSLTIPTTIYVAVIPWIGIYVSSFVLIALFMVWLGKYKLPFAIGLSALIIVATFLTFETWFLVPLPKGPIEDLLGL
jgi:hypothetical protein